MRNCQHGHWNDSCFQPCILPTIGLTLLLSCRDVFTFPPFLLFLQFLDHKEYLDFLQKLIAWLLDERQAQEVEFSQLRHFSRMHVLLYVVSISCCFNLEVGETTLLKMFPLNIIDSVASSSS